MDCPFCQLVDEVVLIENDLCIAIQTRDPVLLGSAMLFPRAHRATPFDITADEWAATRELLLALRDQIDRDHRPDGYNIGWNVGAVGGQEVEHAHLHLHPAVRRRAAGRSRHPPRLQAALERPSENVTAACAVGNSP